MNVVSATFEDVSVKFKKIKVNKFDIEILSPEKCNKIISPIKKLNSYEFCGINVSNDTTCQQSK